MMKSFFRKVSSDAVSFKGKNKRKQFTTQPDFNGQPTESQPSSGNNIWIENCSKVHLGDTYNLSTTNVISTEAAHTSEKKSHNSTQEIPKSVKENLTNISIATIEHFEMVSSKIKDFKCLEKKLGFTENQFQNDLDEVEDELNVCQMLFSWKKALTREATVGLLLEILWEAKEYDAAIYLSENL